MGHTVRMVTASCGAVRRVLRVARLGALDAVAAFAGALLLVTSLALALDGQRRMDANGVHDEMCV